MPITLTKAALTAAVEAVQTALEASSEDAKQVTPADLEGCTLEPVPGNPTMMKVVPSAAEALAAAKQKMAELGAGALQSASQKLFGKMQSFAHIYGQGLYKPVPPQPVDELVGAAKKWAVPSYLGMPKMNFGWSLVTPKMLLSSDLDEPAPLLPAPKPAPLVGRTFVVGDVQGCLDELQDLLAKVAFVVGTDRLIFVGNMVGHGPNSLGVLRLAQGIGAESVLGVNERVLSRLWLGSLPGIGGVLAHNLDNVAKEIDRLDVMWMAALPVMIELPLSKPGWPMGVVVSGGLDPHVPLDEQDVDAIPSFRTVTLTTDDVLWWPSPNSFPWHNPAPVTGAHAFWAMLPTAVWPHWVLFGRVAASDHYYPRGFCLQGNVSNGGHLLAYCVEQDKEISVPARNPHAPSPLLCGFGAHEP